jgi:hypothetical protein
VANRANAEQWPELAADVSSSSAGPRPIGSLPLAERASAGRCTGQMVDETMHPRRRANESRPSHRFCGDQGPGRGVGGALCGLRHEKGRELKEARRLSIINNLIIMIIN